MAKRTLDWSLQEKAKAACEAQGSCGWDRLVLEDRGKVTVEVVKDEEAQWQKEKDSVLPDAHLFFFKELVLVCREAAKSVFQVLCSPIRINSVALAPQTVFDVKEGGKPPVTIRLMFGEYAITLTAATHEARNKWKSTISTLLSKALVEVQVSPRRQPSSETLVSKTTFQRASLQRREGPVVEEDEEADPVTIKAIQDMLLLSVDEEPGESTAASTVSTPVKAPPKSAPAPLSPSTSTTTTTTAGTTAASTTPSTPANAKDLARIREQEQDAGDSSDGSEGDGTPLRRKAALRKAGKMPSDSAAPSPARPVEEVEDPLLLSAGQEQMVLQFVKGELLVMAATRGKLIQYLTSPHARGILCQAPKEGKESSMLKRKVGGSSMLAQTTDQNFLSAFLLTYRLIMTPKEFLAALQQRFELPEEDGELDTMDLSDSQQQSAFQKNSRDTRIKVLTVLKHWISQYWHDFALDAALFADLQELIGLISQLGYEQFVEYCAGLIEEQKRLWREENEPKNVPARQNSGPLASIMLHSDARTLAEQLTLYDAAIFRRIRPVEFLNQIIMPKKKEAGVVDGSTYTKHLAELIERFDKESYWVAAEVIAQDTVKHQAAMIIKFVEVAQHCLRLGNLYSLFAIAGALSFAKVRRLKEAWELVPKKAQKHLQQIEETIMNPTKNMKNYREVVRKLEQESPGKPLLPFIPVVLKDLLFMHEGNTDNVETMINFDKLRMVAKYVLDLKERHNHEYEQRVDPGFQAYLQVACVAHHES